MIKNSEIRKYVTERVQPIKMKLFGYSIVYSIIVVAICSTIMGAFSLLSSLFMTGVGLLIRSIMGAEAYYSFQYSAMNNPLSSIGQIFIGALSFILLIGFMREILMCVNNDKTSPVDFFKLGFSNWKMLIKVYFRLFLKYLIGSVVITIGMIVMIFGGIMLSEELNLIAPGIVLFGIGSLFIIAGIVYSIIVMLRYQTLNYEVIYDNGLSPKDLVKRARENIKGHTWQWFGMSIYYALIMTGIGILLFLLFALMFGGAALIINAQNGVATVIAIILMILAVVLLVAGAMALWLLSNYFSAKNILNLNELYNEIIKEKAQPEYNPIVQE